MPLPTEPIGSVPRPRELIQGIQEFSAGRISRSRSIPFMIARSATRSGASKPPGRRSSPMENRRSRALPPTPSTSSATSPPTAWSFASLTATCGSYLA